MSATFPETTQSRQSTAQVDQPDVAGIANFVRFRDLTRERLGTPDPVKATPDGWHCQNSSPLNC